MHADRANHASPAKNSVRGPSRCASVRVRVRTPARFVIDTLTCAPPTSQPNTGACMSLMTIPRLHTAWRCHRRNRARDAPRDGFDRASTIPYTRRSDAGSLRSRPAPDVDATPHRYRRNRAGPAWPSRHAAVALLLDAARIASFAQPSQRVIGSPGCAFACTMAPSGCSKRELATVTTMPGNVRKSTAIASRITRPSTMSAERSARLPALATSGSMPPPVRYSKTNILIKGSHPCR